MSVVHFRGLFGSLPLCKAISESMAEHGGSVTCPDCLKLLNAPAVLKEPSADFQINNKYDECPLKKAGLSVE